LEERRRGSDRRRWTSRDARRVGRGCRGWRSSSSGRRSSCAGLLLLELAELQETVGVSVCVVDGDGARARVSLHLLLGSGGFRCPFLSSCRGECQLHRGSRCRRRRTRVHRSDEMRVGRGKGKGGSWESLGRVDRVGALSFARSAALSLNASVVLVVLTGELSSSWLLLVPLTRIPSQQSRSSQT
jgi:hypothetical protein